MASSVAELPPAAPGDGGWEGPGGRAVAGRPDTRGGGLCRSGSGAENGRMGESEKATEDRPPGDPEPAGSPAHEVPSAEGDDRPPGPSAPDEPAEGDDRPPDRPTPDEPIPRARAKEQLLVRWRAFPAPAMEGLDRLLDEALARAGQAEPEILTVMNPVSRPVRLRLAPIAADADLDRMYHRASAELSVSTDGRCYLVYRQLDGGDYAVLWSAATALPEALLSRLPDPLATALFESDRDDAP